jgi:hypothetical protein
MKRDAILSASWGALRMASVPDQIAPDFSVDRRAGGCNDNSTARKL